MQSLETLENLNTTIRFCDLCRLAQSRTHAVPGEGASDATLMFVGEAPGKSEDAQGRPFVGRGGQVLERSLADLGLRREQVSVTNIVKCRPPHNRDPRADEIAACRPYLNGQLALMQPKLVVTLGRHALAWFLPEARLSDVHGVLQQNGPYAIFPLYHPAAALRVHARRLAFEAAFKHIPTILQQMA